jgi:uncharacterized membrane protein
MALALNFFIVPILNNGFPYFIDYGLTTENRYLFMSFLTAENWYSIILISFSVSGIIMALILSRRPKKKNYGHSLMKAVVGFAISITLMSTIMVLYYASAISINITLIMIIVSCLIGGLSSTSFNVPVQIIMQNNVDSKQLGKVVSVSSVLSQALIPFASMLAGLVISQFSIIALYVICTLGLLAVVLIYYKQKTYVEI